jgi:hypothetical protein
MLTRIHVNQHIIKRNRKTGRNDPVLTIKTSKSNTYAHEVEILGPSSVIYRPDKPLPCGARVWIETYAQVSPVLRSEAVRNEHDTEASSRACTATAP